MTKSPLCAAELTQLRLEHPVIACATVARAPQLSARFKNYCITITATLAAFSLKKFDRFAIPLWPTVRRLERDAGLAFLERKGSRAIIIMRTSLIQLADGFCAHLAGDPALLSALAERAPSRAKSIHGPSHSRKEAVARARLRPPPS
jgi:hypothetical protein